MSGDDEVHTSAAGRQGRRQLLPVSEVGIARGDGRSRSPREGEAGFVRASALLPGHGGGDGEGEPAVPPGLRPPPLDPGIAAEIMKFKNTDMQSSLKKLVMKLVDQIETLHRVNERIATASKQEEELRENRIPSGVKPFSTNFTSKYLDTLTITTDLKMELTVPSSTSVHDAKNCCTRLTS